MKIMSMKIRKILSIALTLVMLLGLFPGMSLTAYAADEVSENISLVASQSANLKTISGTHYSVSCGYMCASDSGMQVCKSGALTINARKGETITKVVLTYSWGNYKSSLSASAGTFDGNATISDINAQQVTISSSNTAGVKISAVRVYFEGDLNNPTVTLTGGANAKSSGGLLTQSYLPGAMDTVTYTALTGAAFPEFENFTQNGVTVERTSDTVITISGTPTANTEITVPDAESSSKIVTWGSSIIKDSGRNGISYQISRNDSYSDTANGITLTKSGSGYASLDYGDWMTNGDVTLNFTTATGKFTSIEIETSQIYGGGNWTKDGNTLKWNGTPSNSVSLSGSRLYLEGVSSVNFVIEMPTFSVTITPGSNMTKTETSGAASQTGLSGAMTDVVYTADDGYYFPTDYSVAAVNGITVTRNSYTQITVSGTPTADATITLTAPTAKTTPDAPTAAAATDCTTADNNDGKLTGVTNAMEYKKSDAANWTAGTGSDITGLVPGTYYVRVKATETTNASTNQELTIKGFISYTVTFKVVNGKWNEGEGDAATADKTVTLTGHDGDTLNLTADQIPAVGSKPNDTYKAGSWDVTPSTNTAITAATTYTYTYVAKEAAAVTKEPEGKTLTYNGQEQALVTAGEATGGTMQYALGDANGATQPYTTSIPTGTNAGTYYVWYRVKGDSNHNDVAAASVTVTINKKLLTITAGAKSKVYGEKDPELTYDSTGLVEGDNITGSLTRDAGENAGTYAITQGTVTASDNYELSYVPALLTITKADSNTTAPTANELNYSGSAQELVTAGTPTGGTLVYSTDGESYNEMIPTGINAGEYTVYYKVIGDANHNDKVVQQVTVTILARTLDIKADEKSKTYGEDDPALTYTSEGLVEGDSITGALSRAEGENVGTYAIEQGTLTAGDNYIITYTGANLAITEAASSVTTEPVTKMPTYNGGKQTLVAGGEVAGGTMQYALGTDAEIAPTEGWSTSIPAETDAGTYYVWYRAVGDNNHSDVEATCVSVDIEKAAITITADDKSSQKGAELQELSWQVSGDYVSGDELGISASTTADSSADAGVYPITVSWNDNANYEATLISGKYTITAPEESGRVETKTIVADNVPSCSISNLTTELARSLATEEELIRVQNGENLLIYLDMENIDDSVSATDKSLVEAAVKASSKDAKVGMYLDLTLYKKVGDGAATKVTDTKESRISVTIEVPDSLKGGSDVTRTFYIIRVHDGATDILATTTETTITFETDKFSTYALAYSDKSNGSPSVTTPAQQEKAPKTGDNFPSVWLWALILAGGLVPVGYAGGRHKGLERK